MRINRKYCNLNVLFFSFVFLFGVVSCKPVEEDVLFRGDTYKNLMQYIDENPNFSSFKSIAEAGKMNDALSSFNTNGGVDYTLFLPTNDAVSAFISGNSSYSDLNALLQDKEYCAEIVRYHLVNGRISSKDFPNGALANKTISNYFLTISFRESNNAVTFAVNDVAKVLITDIALSNGTIHTIDKMLTPVVYTSYEWLAINNDFKIFSELLSKCGLADTLNAFETDELGRKVYNEYTLFAESDALYAANNITSFDALIQRIDPSGNTDYTNPSNLVNKYARYHILETSVFLDEFKAGVYNTYGDFPIGVDVSNNNLRFNPRTITDGGVSTVFFLQVNLDNSNIVTRSGSIHQLDQLLFPYLPGRQTVTYQFYEEPVVNALKTVEGEHYILAQDLTNISLIGARGFHYVRLTAGLSGLTSNDYLRLLGDVEFSFTTPKILAGRYTLRLVMDRGRANYASVQAIVDGQNVGVVTDLTKDKAEFRNFVIGTVDFSDFSTHTVKLKTVIPGTLLIDRIIFEPI